MDERRLKVVYLRDQDVVKILNWRHADNGDCLTLGGPGIPDDAVVHHCYYDAERNSTAVVLYHDSFGIVIEGCETPMMFGAEVSRVIQKGPEASPVDLCDPRCIYCDMLIIDGKCINPISGCPVTTSEGRAYAVANVPPVFEVKDDKRIKSLDDVLDTYKDELSAELKEDFLNHRYLGNHFVGDLDTPEAVELRVRPHFEAMATHPENVVTNTVSEGNGCSLIEFYERIMDNPIPAPEVVAKAILSTKYPPKIHPDLLARLNQEQPPEEPEEDSTEWFQRVMGNG